jgi:hypothetical protein
MRKQNAIYWPPASVDDFGREAHGALVELILVPGGSNFRVRWEDKNEEFLDAAGTTRHSNAVVYCPVLPGGSEVAVGGFLWLGNRNDLTDEAVPRDNPGAYEVRRFDKLPNLRATEFLRTAYL